MTSTQTYSKDEVRRTLGSRPSVGSSMRHRNEPKHHKSSMRDWNASTGGSNITPVRWRDGGFRGIKGRKMRADGITLRWRWVDVSGFTLVWMRVLRTPRLDHLPQVLPPTLWLTPPLSPTRRQGRDTSCDTSLLHSALVFSDPQTEIGQDHFAVQSQTWTFVEWRT